MEATVHPDDMPAVIQLTITYILLLIFCYYLTTLMQP
jgi:hypothetical protein